MYNNRGNEYAYAGLKTPISSANINKTGYMLNERVKYTANTQLAVISTANSNLDGTGAGVVDLITGASNGTIVKRIIIKSQQATTQGMIRIFFKAGASTWLLREVDVPSTTQSANDQTFIAIINEPFYLKPSYLLRVSTEKGETFIITAEGMNMTYPA